MILGLDLGTELTGFCVGEGDVMPWADAWSTEQVGDDLGLLGAMLWDSLDGLHRSHRLSRVIYESPLLLKRDKLMKLRKLYGMGIIVETWAARARLPVTETTPISLKKELCGRHDASKDDMVAAAVAIGVTLPKTFTAGRRDAADAFAAWLFGLRCYAPHHRPRWDKAMAKTRGGLL